MFVKINEYKVERETTSNDACEVSRLVASTLNKSKTYDVRSAEFIYDPNPVDEGSYRMVKLELMFADDVNNSSKVTEMIACNVPDYSTEIYFMNENGKTIDSFEF